MTSEEEKTVCVTGASGYFASWIVKLLLLCGYTVKASVRNPSAKERLQLFKANLLEEGSFDSAIDGCQGVFHTASPFYHDVKDPQVTCLKTPSVKRVVLTSSIASVAFNGMPRTPETIVDETWFADLEYCRAAKLWYVLSNTLAENAAWKFAKENDLQLVWINAEMVIGPLLQPTLNTSAAAVLSLIKGKEKRFSIGLMQSCIPSGRTRAHCLHTAAIFPNLLNETIFAKLPLSQGFNLPPLGRYITMYFTKYVTEYFTKYVTEYFTKYVTEYVNTRRTPQIPTSTSHQCTAWSPYLNGHTKTLDHPKYGSRRGITKY
ncbi:unnamed protein product [Brassica oleracea]|uniref:(rape) hypothetical protein n=1 Tax=Brassica napus TaxID=3708 RepID=A0A816Q4I0_BRANA|nr:unnamed protein product [Brassica napus]